MGRDRRNESKTEHYTKMIRNMMETPAWRALSPTAQALYPWLKFEWRGAQNNNNGKIRLSVRQAAERLGVSNNTAARAFHDLQAKGFIVVRKPAALGLSAQATSPEYELTEIPPAIGMRSDPDDPKSPPWDRHDGRKLYRNWRGHDFPVVKATVHNTQGRGRRGDVVRLVVNENKTLS